MSRTAWLALAGAMLAAAPVVAITYGQPDTENQFPNVGLVITPAPGGGFFICSGTLISETLVLTAGHCTDNPAPYYVTFKQAGPYSLRRDFIEGDGIPHPDWTGAFTIPNTNDIGLVVLKKAVRDIVPAELAPLGFVDYLLTQRGTQQLEMIAVGYGLQESSPTTSKRPQQPWDLARWWGEQRLLQSDSAYTGGYNIELTNNAGIGGGTCSGDSGGPIFHKASGFVVAVNSFGLAPHCKGNDYAYRVDIPNSSTFIFSYW
jgi:hypothetical protein